MPNLDINQNRRLIMPKQTGKLEPFFGSLKIYYDARNRDNNWVDSYEFIPKICELVDDLHVDDDRPKLVKQSELTRYFGFVEYDYSTQIGRARITSKGIEFYEAFLKKDTIKQYDLIMESIENNSFGRNNTAIKDSNSDVDAPKVFVKAIIDLNGITRKDLAYLLYITNDLGIEYEDALCELAKRNDDEREIPIELSNKYNDVKFTVLLENLGFCISDTDHKYILNNYINTKYYDVIKSMSIYNKTPDFILTLKETDETNEDNDVSTNYIKDINDIDQQKIINAFIYDITSLKFQKQNEREPESYKTRTGNTKYKTNSRIAKTALNLQDYKCAINSEHTTFISKAGFQYMEAHHLVPMHAQKDFNENLDRIENILSLCPICHSAIHLGNQATRMDLVKKLFEKTESALKRAGINISFGELFSRYYN